MFGTATLEYHATGIQHNFPMCHIIQTINQPADVNARLSATTRIIKSTI